MSAAVWHRAPQAPVNLLPAGRRLALKRRRRLKAWIMVLCGYAAALLGVWAWCGVGARLAAHDDQQAGPGSSGSAAQRLATVTADIDRLHNERNKVRSEVVTIHRKLDAARAVGHHADWSVLLQLLAELGGPPHTDVVLERIELRPRPAQANDPAAGKPKSPAAAARDNEVPDPWGYSLSLDGLAGSQIDVVRFAAGLEGLQLFESVSIVGTHPRDSTAPDAPGLHLVSFQIACTLTDAGAAAHAAPPLATGHAAPAQSEHPRTADGASSGGGTP
jgi:hypothetical protein